MTNTITGHPYGCHCDDCDYELAYPVTAPPTRARHGSSDYEGETGM